jgi:hypothetical protein
MQPSAKIPWIFETIGPWKKRWRGSSEVCSNFYKKAKVLILGFEERVRVAI